jgi:RNA polymerase sigma factor (TIGR02999 family)
MPTGQPYEPEQGLSFSPSGDGRAAEGLNRLWVEAEAELRRLAHRRLRLERSGHTLVTTALVNEVYLKLVSQRNVAWSDRAQFLALAAGAMRRILIDYARRHRRLRDRVRYDSGDADDLDSQEGGDRACRLPGSQRADELLALDDALERLALFDERLCRVVECRFFGGYTEEETAAVLGVTARTIARDWVKAKAWLYRELQDAPSQS